MVTLVLWCISSGGAFHILEPATLKVLSPMERSRDVGTGKRHASLERREIW